MIYADSEYYQANYLLGRAVIIPPSEFLFWEEKARTFLGKHEIDDVPDCLKKCVCELAEAFFLDSEKQALGMLPTQSVGGFTQSYTTVKQDPREFNRGLREIVSRHLCGTPLHNTFIYRGV